MFLYLFVRIHIYKVFAHYLMLLINNVHALIFCMLRTYKHEARNLPNRY